MREYFDAAWRQQGLPPRLDDHAGRPTGSDEDGGPWPRQEDTNPPRSEARRGATAGRGSPAALAHRAGARQLLRQPQRPPPGHLYDLVLREVEEPLFRAVLDYAEGNQSRAADILGINRGTLRKKLKNYGFSA